MVIAQDSSHPTGVTSNDPDGKEAIRARDRKANAALQMKTMGANWDEIAEVLGYPTARHALVATERALEKELRSESKEALRKMVDRKLERLLRAVMPKATDENNPEQLAAVGKARELIADHRKVWGLDAPTEVSVYNPAEGEIEQWVATVVKTKTPELEEADIFDVDPDEDDTEFLAEGDADAAQAG